MNSAGVLLDGFGRVHESVAATVEGLSPELLHARLDAGANTISWLVWHLSRVQDDHVADVAGVEQAWTSRGWAEAFALSLPEHDIGYGHGDDEVAAVVTPSADDLIGYHDAVHELTVGYLRALRDTDLDTVVDEAWDPPVTLGVRLVSVLDDTTRHVGQAEFVRGVLKRRAR